MTLPIETVLDLLMENASPAKCGGGQIMLGGELYDSLREDDLRGYIRTYLQSLVPAPKLLSECEEGKPVEAEYLPPRFRVTTSREGDYAVGKDGEMLGLASDFQVIPPDEAGGRAGQTGDFVWRELLADDVQ